jgi:hypothetical protein
LAKWAANNHRDAIAAMISNQQAKDNPDSDYIFLEDLFSSEKK